MESLLKQHIIEIDLFPEKINIEFIVKNISNEMSLMKEKMKNMEENYIKIIDKQNIEINYYKELKEENKILKEKIKI